MDNYQRSPFAELSSRLASIDNFSEAAEDLKTLLILTPSHITSQPKKLIALLEVSKSTLKRAGIRLHTFTSCRPVERPYKTAYFNLLCEAQKHFSGVLNGQPELQARFNRLLFPLTSQLVISHSSCADHTGTFYRAESKSDSGVSSSSSLPSNIEARHQSTPSHHFTQPVARTVRLPPPPPGSMLPPSLSPAPGIMSTVAATQSSNTSPMRSFHAPTRPSSPRARTAASVRRRRVEADNDSHSSSFLDAGVDVENVAPPSIAKVQRRSFGIMFTGKRQGNLSAYKPIHRITSGG